MSASIISFDPVRRFARPCMVLSRLGKLHSGEDYFSIDYLETEDHGGGQIGLWAGTDYGEALAELLDLSRQGYAVHEMIGGGL